VNRIRIGQGFDAHRFKQGTRLILAGVGIPYDSGMEAHSDGDVVIHALCDAILGALAMGDIGKHFPDADQQYQGIDSRILLRDVIDKMLSQEFFINNIDITIIAQAPKLNDYISDMERCLADDCKIHTDLINIKATTTEKMGFTGRGEGIAAMASVIIVSDKK
jgi:2-C-methyl-D-erythritol 2,4-cyclodiphosphate synthase